MLFRGSLPALFLLPLLACGSGISGSEEVDAAGAPPPISSDASPGCTADVAATYYEDLDGDGFGTDRLTAVDCIVPAGFVDNSDDCNDADSRINPNGIEFCDGIDSDCNQATTETCPAGCTPYENEGDNYIFCNIGASQPDAVTTCASQDMRLVRVDSSEEQSYLSDQRIVAFGGRKKTHIGGTDQGVENTWVWQDGDQFWQGKSGGTAIDGLFTFWRGSEPNDDGTQDCAAMRDSNSNTGRWVDISCGQVNRYICERDRVLLNP